MLPIRTVLHATDFSERSAYAFETACALARDYGARLVVVHVKPPPAAAFGELGPVIPEPADLAEGLRGKLEGLKPADPAVAVEYRLAEGDAAAEILYLAQEVGADLIVLGTHGRTGLGRLLLGSVAEEVLRRAPCPVLTVRTPFLAAVPARAEAGEPVPI